MTKKGGIILFTILLNTVFTFAQNEANIWYFGDFSGLDFNSGVPVPLLDSQLTNQEGCASIAITN